MISLEVLRRYPYFSAVCDDSLKAIAAMADETTVSAGEQIFCEGNPADTLYFIARGEVDLQYNLGSGELRTVDTLRDGDILGWSALLEPYRYTGAGTATKATRLIAIRARELRDLCDRDPLLGLHLMDQIAKLLATRLEGAQVQLAAAD
ncbi:MAG: cyclic nucleotide-binding domain-containing protein [Pirellulales bacterium]|nr:cyclic nucleotide-binding domain-containing protein [Pirellulales bacterium]